MSKLNEEILDTLYDARYRLQLASNHYKKIDDETNMRLIAHKLARLDRVWDYFQAQRVVEEFRHGGDGP